MRRAASEPKHNGARFTGNTHDTGYLGMKIKDGQKTAYGDPDQQGVLTTVDTITTIVAIWQMLKRPIMSDLALARIENPV